MPDKNLTRKYLTNNIFKNLGFSKNLSSKIVDNFFELLILEILNAKKVKISSFGSFNVINKKERIGRNPKTRVEAKITSRKVISFKPSHLLKEKLNKNKL